MSAFYLGMALRFSKVKGSGRLAAIALADMADENGLVCAPLKDIAASARLSMSAVQAGISKMVEAGEAAIYATPPSKPVTYLLLYGENHHSDMVKTTMTADMIDEIEQSDYDEEADFSDFIAPPPSPAAMAPTFDNPVTTDPQPLKEAAPPPAEPQNKPEHVQTKTELVQVTPALEQVRPREILPSHLPPSDVGRLLHAAGVEVGESGLGFWWRREHADDLREFLSRMQLDVHGAIHILKSKGVKVAELRRISDLESYLRG